MDRRHQEAGERQRVQRVDRIEDVERQRPRPPARDHAPVPDIGGHNQRVREPRRHLHQPLAVLDRPCADDDAARSIGEQRLNVIAVAHAAADLHVGIGRAEDVAHDFDVGPVAGGGVEVDRMQRMKPGVPPAARHRHGIVEPHRLAVISAADELHAGAIAQVHRRKDDHASPPTKACTNRTPGAELFSGWNWTPTVRRHRTTAGNRSPPASVHAVTDPSSVGRQT